MASGVSGSVSTTIQGHTIRIYYQEDYSIDNNVTDILKITKISITPNNRSDAFYVGGDLTVNNTKILEMDTKVGAFASGSLKNNIILSTKKSEEGILYQYTNGKWQQLTAELKNINHNDDGSKSIDILLDNFELISIISGNTQVSNYDKEWTIKLADIPRAANIDSATDVILGSPCIIKWIAKTLSYYYKIRLEIGDWYWESNAGDIPKTDNLSYTYITPNLTLDIANQIPNDVSGVLTVYLYTYSDVECTKQISTRTSKSIIVTIPDTIVPVLNSLELSLLNENTQLSQWNMAVLGKTSIQLSAKAEGSYGSTISTFIISGDYNAEVNSEDLLKVITFNEIITGGQKQFHVQAIDSRGRASNLLSSEEVFFFAHKEPQIIYVDIGRNETDNTQIIAKMNWNYSYLGGRNYADARFFYKKTDDSEWQEYIGVVIQDSPIVIENCLEDNSYNFKLTIVDRLGTYVEEIIFVPTVDVTIDLRAGGKGIGFGKICESDNFEVNMGTIFMKDIYIQIDPTTKEMIVLSDYIKQIVNADYINQLINTE